MKVVFVLCSRLSGGAERHLLQLMQGLSKRSVECIFAGPSDGWLGRQLVEAGFRCVHIPFTGIFDVASVLRLTYLLRKEKADLVHGHLTRAAYYVGIAAKFAGIPNVATAHSTNAGKRFDRATRIIAVANAVERFLVQRGYSPDRIRTIHNGISDPTLLSRKDSQSVREDLGIENGAIISMVARFIPDKGHDIALRALASISDYRWTLLLAGPLDSECAKNTQALANELGIYDRIRFLGHIEDVASVYGCTDILLAPSRREAFSLTLLEASAFQIPIIATDVGGIAEAIVDGETGVLVPVNDAEALASRVRTLLIDANKRMRLGAAGRARYLANFTDEKMITGTLNVYQEAIDEASHE